MCLICELTLPRFEDIGRPSHALAKTFWGRVQLVKAEAYLSLKDGNESRKLLHTLKYRNEPDLGKYLGVLFARELMRKKVFSQSKPDFLLPVPLHPKKEKRRGYNQSLLIAQGISEITGIPILGDVLKRIVHNKSQTSLDRKSRWKSSKSLFALNRTKGLEGKHLCIVDDVVTTGSTIDAIASHLLEIQKIKLSLLSLAFTD